MSSRQVELTGLPECAVTTGPKEDDEDIVTAFCTHQDDRRMAFASVETTKQSGREAGKCLSTRTGRLASVLVMVTLILLLCIAAIPFVRKTRATEHYFKVPIKVPADFVGLPCAVLIPGQGIESRHPGEFEPFVYTACICTDGTISEVRDDLPEHDLDWMSSIMFDGNLEYDSSEGPVYCLGNYLVSQSSEGRT